MVINCYLVGLKIFIGKIYVEYSNLGEEFRVGEIIGFRADCIFYYFVE